VVLLWRAVDGVVVHEGRLLALRRVVLWPDLVEGAQIVAGYVVAESHVRERHSDLRRRHPDQLVATYLVDVVAGQLSAIPQDPRHRRRSGGQDECQRGVGYCDDATAPVNLPEADSLGFTMSKRPRRMFRVVLFRLIDTG
jgi:hypothetical protein